MSQSDNHIHDSFERSSVPPGERRVDLALLNLRKTAIGEYWRIVRDMPSPVPDDLERLMPRASLPRLVDGEITIRYKDVLAEDKDVISETVQITSAASRGQVLLELLREMENDDPEFLDLYFDTLYDGHKVDLIMALHVIGETDELRDRLIGQLAGIDDFLLGVQRSKDDFLDNEYYPIGHHLSEMTKHIASAYIMQRAPVRNDQVNFVPDEELEPYLAFARKYKVNPRALEHINTRTPLPKSLSGIHVNGLANFSRTLQEDIGLAQSMSRMRADYDRMYDEERLAFGRLYLESLAQAYGIHPPPALDVNPETTSLGSHMVWDIGNKQACFAHPLGRIFVPNLSASFTEFIETLSHEFTHGLEDLALYSLNTEFQDWRKENPDAVKLGDDAMQKRLRSSAFALSFNTACYMSAGFDGTREAGYDRGTYYTIQKATNDESGEKQKKLDLLYADQLRERHACLYGYVISTNFAENLDKMERYRDPLNIVMMAQNGMGRATEYIRDTLLPVIPADKREAYQEMARTIDGHFENADAREASYRERMTGMKDAFTGVRDMISRAVSDEYVSSSHPASRDMYKLGYEIISHVELALRIMDYNESTPAAKTGNAPQQVPA